MPAAVIGGAIAAVGGIGSAIIGNKGASNAANATTQAAQTATDAQSQMYNQNAAALRPYQMAGLPATQQINALLGIGGGNMGGQSTQQYGGPMAVNENGQPNALSHQTAFDNYRNSTGYQFRLGQGMNAINSGYAGAGSIKSGAAMKSINDYGQGMASQEFGNYLNALGNQQALGFSAASAQSGVGQNYANNISNIAMQKGSDLANASLVKSQNSANALGSAFNTGAYLYGRYG